jgi:hypothetical protein
MGFEPNIQGLGQTLRPNMIYRIQAKHDICFGPKMIYRVWAKHTEFEPNMIYRVCVKLDTGFASNLIQGLNQTLYTGFGPNLQGLGLAQYTWFRL